MTTRRTSSTRLRPALLAVAVLLLTGCTDLSLAPPEDAAGGSVTRVGSGEVDQLTVGDCITVVDGDLHSGFDPVPCTAPHDWEVYLDLEIAGRPQHSDDIDDTDAVVAAAEEGCGAALRPFLDLPDTATSALGYTYLVPDGSADRGRVVRCLIGDMNGPVTGSLAGAAR